MRRHPRNLRLGRPPANAGINSRLRARPDPLFRIKAIRRVPGTERDIGHQPELRVRIGAKDPGPKVSPLRPAGVWVVRKAASRLLPGRNRASPTTSRRSSLDNRRRRTDALGDDHNVETPHDPAGNSALGPGKPGTNTTGDRVGGQSGEHRPRNSVPLELRRATAPITPSCL
jgi:hypothetical protein